MSSKTGSLDYWRKFFRASDSDIFEVIEYAILVAASDCPKEFRIRRDGIAQNLYTCRLIRCCECDSVTLHKHEEEDKGGFQGGFEGGFPGKESKVNSSTNDCDDRNRISNYSYDEAEALTEEIEEETQIVGEVLRIKDVLENPDESDNVLFDSLRRLQLMELSFETLKATEIGKAVNGIRKHGSKQIRNLSRILVCGWKVVVDEWVSAANAISGDTPDSAKPASCVEEEEGLPSPPMDEELFLATQPTSMELSQFFDGMDDDGNPGNNIAIDVFHENGRKSKPEYQNPWRKPPSNEGNLSKEEKGPIRKQETINKQTRPSETRVQARDSGPGRPQKLSLGNKINGDSKLHRQSDSIGIQKKPSTGLGDKPKCSEDTSVRVKLEATKRKLQEGYQQAENAKKQRTIQVMELHDLPKQGLGHKNPHFKPGLHNRHWNNGRH